MAHGPLGVDALPAAAGARPDICVPLLALTFAFAVGWWRLRRRMPRSAPVSRLLWHAAGIAALAVALVSPIASRTEESFLAHMIQHLLLIKVAAPALLLANPLVAMLWALPQRLRSRVGCVLAPGRPVRKVWVVLTRAPVAWVLYLLTLWIWHVSAVWEAAVGDRLVHDAEHIAFFGTAVLFWWPVVRPAPRSGKGLSEGARVIYLVLAAFQESVLGLLLALSTAPLYPSFALDDQIRGGIAMWAAGGAANMAAVLVLLWLALGHSERAPTEAFARAAPRA